MQVSLRYEAEYVRKAGLIVNKIRVVNWFVELRSPDSSPADRPIATIPLGSGAFGKKRKDLSRGQYSGPNLLNVNSAKADQAVVWSMVGEAYAYPSGPSPIVITIGNIVLYSPVFTRSKNI
jgi:hypothetical protein